MSRFERNPPASTAQIAAAGSLPADYVAWLSEQNGGVGMIGRTYIQLWRADELIQVNADYGFPTYAPELLAFASTGGGEAFAFDRREPSWPVVMVPFISLDYDDARRVAESFSAFMKLMKSRRSVFKAASR